MTFEKGPKKISVVGLGYIGLPTAAMFASRKLEVVGVDVNQHVVDTINNGGVHIVEPDLDIVVSAAVSDGYLRAVTEPEPSDIFIIAVPTPFKDENHIADLACVEAAARAIAPVLIAGNLVILESTSPVGTTEMVANLLSEERSDLSFPQDEGERSDIRVAHCPERVLPGKVMQELITNDRVIGGMTSACSSRASELYRIFVTGECLLASCPRVAEMTKLTENSFRDVNIAFANELSLICNELGVDVWELLELANRHPRVNVLRPGPGVGGHCIAVDPWFIVSSSPQLARLIRVAREVNDAKPHWVVDMVGRVIAELTASTGWSGNHLPKVACYGLAFKADIDDLRQSPALEIVSELSLVKNCELLVVEPNISQLPGQLPEMRLISAEGAIDEADIHLILVAHAQFQHLRFPAHARIIDVVGLYKARRGSQ